ncbi:transporter particle component [Kwoniella heveanensis CBS 569]|nr:transporter particle component [Kwoniella heveanensis CBS 569]
MSARPSTSSTHLPPAPSIPPAIHHLATPAPILIDSILPSYLLPNVLNLLRDSSRSVVRRKKEEEDQLRAEGLLPPLQSDTSGQGQGQGKGKGKVDEGHEEERLVEVALGKKVERIGLMVGGYIAEKLTLARPPLATHLDMIKFICKDLFLYVYSKQIDNLRTNHRGIFVLQSHSFPPLSNLSSHRGSSADMETAKLHLLFPQALIQGALARLGMHAIVTAESAGLPQCTFQIRTIKNPAAGTGNVNNPSTPSLAGTPTPNQGAGVGPGNVGATAGASASAGAGVSQHPGQGQGQGGRNTVAGLGIVTPSV